VLRLEFAAEDAIIQTRFFASSLLALRLLIGSETDLDDVPDAVQRTLTGFQPTDLAGYRHFVFLGRHWRYGVALGARLNVQETSLLNPEAHETLDYRHGPIASADAETLVWCFDPLDDPAAAGVIEDVRRTGAAVRWTGDDPLAGLAEVHALAVCLAGECGVDCEAPRNLTRAIVLPSTGAS
jgi:fructoselysine-6-P-deglycase FrlB-like protein